MTSSLEERLLNYLEKAKNHDLNFLSFGWGKDIDDRTMGLEPENLVIVAGANKSGKTTMAVNTAAHNAENGAKTLVVTTEVTPQQYILRLVCREIGISLRDIREGNLSQDQHDAAMERSRHYANLSTLRVIGRGHCTTSDVEFDIRNYGPELVIVDHLQRIDPETDNNALGYKHVSQKLKQLALEYEVPVMVLSQVTMNDDWVDVGDNGDYEYKMDSMSLRWSKEPLGEGDKILFLHNLERSNIRHKGLMNVIFHSLRDYESGGYKTVRVNYNHQKVYEGPELIVNSPFNV